MGFARLRGVVMRLIILLFSLFVLPACGMSPLQYSFMKDIGLQDSDYIVMSADEVRAELGRYANVTVSDGIYKIPKPGDAPIGPWCTSASTYKKADWVCTHYANWAAAEMDGFAFGVARDGNHRLNIHLVDDNGEVRIALYDPQRCQWSTADIEQVVITSSRTRTPAAKHLYAVVGR